MEPLVGIIMGSTSDWETMRHAADALTELGVPHETKVVSAHRTPQRLYDYATQRRRSRAEGDHRGRGRRGASAGHGGVDDASAGARRAGGIKALKGIDSLLFDRPDAGRRAGGHAGDRQGRGDQRRAARGGDPRDRRTRRWPSGSRRGARRRPTASATDPRMTTAAARLDHRHPRRRTARADAGVGGGAARLSHACPRARCGERRGADRRRASPAPIITAASCSTKWPAQCDVVTYEFENIALEPVDYLSTKVPVHPAPAALAIAQDRASEKALRRRASAGAPRRGARSRASTNCRRRWPRSARRRSSRRCGSAMTARARCGSRRADEAEAAWDAIGQRPAILEGVVDLRPRILDHPRARRGRVDGQLSAAVERHVDGILAHLDAARARPRSRRNGASPRRWPAGSPTRSTMSACWRASSSPAPTARCSTRWRRACTIRGIGRSRARSRRSSKTTSARSAACRSATPR